MTRNKGKGRPRRHSFMQRAFEGIRTAARKAMPWKKDRRALDRPEPIDVRAARRGGHGREILERAARKKRKVDLYRAGFHTPGNLIVLRDGTAYNVQRDGSWRKAGIVAPGGRVTAPGGGRVIREPLPPRWSGAPPPGTAPSITELVERGRERPSRP